MAIDVYKQWLGIPEEFRPPTHYQLLRLVDFEDDPDKIRTHYKKLNEMVRKYATGDFMLESQQLLNELAKAMLCLTDTGRKRDYDESLGREFAEDADGSSKPLLRVLADWGDITKSQIREVEEFAERRGLTHRDAVVQMKLASDDKAAMALAAELGRPYVDLETMYPEDRILDMVPRKVVKRNNVLPLFVDDDVVLIACIDEPDHELEDEFRLRFDKPMRAVIGTPRQIHQGIAKHYAPGERDEAVADSLVTTGKSSAPAKKSSQKKTEKAASGKKTLKNLNQLTDQEKKDRKMLGVIFMCWSFVVPAVIDQMLIQPNFFPTWTSVPNYIRFGLLVTTIPILTFVMIYDEYLKKR